jgi:hypothetical protein
MSFSESSVARRRRALGLYASGVTTRQLPETIKRQLVLTQMSKDPEKKLGPRMIKQLIARDTGIHLTRCVKIILLLQVHSHEVNAGITSGLR